MGVDYVDLEADVAVEIPRPSFGKTKRIVSLHDFKRMPAKIEELAERIEKGDPDIIKIACVAKTLADASRMLAFRRADAEAHDWAGDGAARGVYARSGREVRRTVHFRGVQPRPHVRAGHAKALGLEERLSVRRDQRRDRGFRCRRRPDRAQPEPGRPQRGVPSDWAEQGDGADPDSRRDAQGIAGRARLVEHEGDQRHDPAQGGDPPPPERRRQVGRTHGGVQYRRADGRKARRPQHRLSRGHAIARAGDGGLGRRRDECLGGQAGVDPGSGWSLQSDRVRPGARAGRASRSATATRSGPSNSRRRSAAAP